MTQRYGRVYTNGMEASWSEIIREAVRASGASEYAIAKAAGVPYPRLYEFMRGRTSDLRLHTAERIAGAVGLRLTLKRKAKGR